MKSEKYSFLFVIVSVLGILGLVFYLSERHLNYIEKNPRLAAGVEAKKEMIRLKKRMDIHDKVAQRTNKRSVAAINTQMTLETIKEMPYETRPENYFLRVEEDCTEMSLKSDCLTAINLLVTEFPKSKWTAEAFVMLARYYVRNGLKTEALELKFVVQREFRDEPRILAKFNEIEGLK